MTTQQNESLEVTLTAAALARDQDPWAPDGPQNETEWDLCAASWRSLAQSRQFSPDELDQLSAALRIVIGTYGADVLPETLERMRALRSKVLQLAFMETCRDD